MTLLNVRHTETATHTIARMVKCKDCKQVSKVVRDARWYLGWEQVQIEAPVLVFGQLTTWVDARGKLARPTCKHCGSSNTSANTIRGTFSEQETCGSKCRSSKGPVCECSCSGANHGSNY